MNQDLIGYAFFGLYWVVFVYSMVLHEIAHGYSSYRLGDPTAWKAGRLTLNPIKHIDPVMSVIMPVFLFIVSKGSFIFGGAKAAPINPLLYRNMRAGMFISAGSGPLVNLCLATIFALLMKFSLALSHGQEVVNSIFFSACMQINLVLAIFNLLPIPPLDGSHMLASVLPQNIREPYERLRPFGFLILMTLLVVPVTGAAIWIVIDKATHLYSWALHIPEQLSAYGPMDLLHRRP